MKAADRHEPQGANGPVSSGPAETGKARKRTRPRFFGLHGRNLGLCPQPATQAQARKREGGRRWQPLFRSFTHSMMSWWILREAAFSVPLIRSCFCCFLAGPHGLPASPKNGLFKAVMTLLRGRATSDSKTGNARLARVSCRT